MPRIQTISHCSELGAWSVALYDTPPALAQDIDQIWIGRGQVAYAMDQIIPTGVSTLLINLGAPQWMVKRDKDPEPFIDIWWSGPHDEPIGTKAPNGSEILGVLFTPLGASRWMPCPQRELRNTVRSLTDYLGDSVLRLREEILNAPSDAARFARIEQWLMRRSLNRAASVTGIAWALESLVQASVGQIATHLGWSRKHLHALFQRDIGLSPRQYASLQRFNRFRALLDATPAGPLATLAIDAGYHDQAHMSRDFKRFMLMTPTQYRDAPKPDPGSVVVQMADRGPQTSNR